MDLIHFSWTDFLKIAVIIVILWFVLAFFKDVFQRTQWFGKAQDSVQRIMDILVLLFEPAAVLLLLGVFIFINPWLHGLLVALFLGGGFNHFRNYLSGRIVRFDDKVKVGKEIKVGSTQGIINSKERLGLRLKTSKGLQYIGYSSLLQQGFMLLANKEIGGYYHLKISPKEPDENRNHLEYLKDLLVTAPFIDRNYIPEFSVNQEDASLIGVQVSVREKTHLTELIDLIKVRGYACKILKK